ncbi:MAG: DNA mismatch endonuclease Vsr [Clostridia bacterium]|nr:DNA mismatch endonuclease Vsr [Clostridia bacterium]
MTDIKSRERRSQNMAAIKSKDTIPERYVRRTLFLKGFRYRKNDKRIIGHPDMFLPKYRTAIYVNGCFWHRHEGCKYAYLPKSNVDFWEEKFRRNVERDLKIYATLKEQCMKCIVIWECSVRKMMKSQSYESDIIQKIKVFFNSPDMFLEL